MRVTFMLNYAGLAGGVRVVAIYAERLKQRGHEVVIISRQAQLNGVRERLRDLARRTRWRLQGQRPPSHLNDVDVEHRVLPAGIALSDEHFPDADVVVATWWETAEWIRPLSPSKGAKALFLQHYETHAGQPIERVKATWRLPMHKIAVARWLVDLAREEYGDEHVSLVPNSVDLEQFHAAPRSKQPATTVGMMYSATPFKACDVALEAVDLARHRVPGLKLVAFGMTQPAPHLPLPPGAEYVVLPAQERIPALYASCDAWLFSSRSEGFGLPILEAMACRTPVIGVPTGAAPELIGAGGGLLVRPEDPQAMADAIVALHEMPEARWRAMSDAAHRTATSYTWDDATDRFEEALHAAVERSGRGEPAGAAEPAGCPA